MTKKEFIKMIFETLDNTSEKKDQIIAISGLIDVLEPRDREQFSKWGFKKDQSTPAKCWK